MRNIAATGLLVVLVVVACGPAETEAPPKLSTAPSAAVVAPAPPAAMAAPLPGMKPSVLPGDDFDAYANGAWSDATEIPKDQARMGVGWEVYDRTNHRVQQLIQDAEKNPSPEAKKVAAYYAAFMDEAAIEKRGLDPLKDPIAAIAAIKDRTALARALGGQIRADTDVLNLGVLHTGNVMGVWVAEDLDDPKHNAAFLMQGGGSLPSRAYYFDASPKMTETREAFRAHVEAVLTLAKVSDAKARSSKIVELERRIVESHLAPEDASSVEKGDNHWSRKDLDTKAPGLDWSTFLAAAKLDKQTGFVAWHPKAITGLSALAKSEPLDTWKDYLLFHLVDRWSGVLPKAFADERFAFYGKTLNGVEAQRARWERAVEVTSDALGEAVGKLYTEKYFPPSEKARAEQMVKNIIAAFEKRIDALAWMDPKTKAKAKAKLATLLVGVGYPDHWRDYSALTVTAADALGNERRAEQFEYDRNLAKLGKPVDRGEWVMNAHMVDAVNLPVRNAIQFPAGILQPPFFDPDRPPAMDYGATGAVIGHEVSHSFDNQGALFDETGKKLDWWTPGDLAHFEAAGAALARQYDAYHPFPDLAVNGKQTLGENIADVAGLTAAYDAFHASLGGAEAPAFHGLNGDQQFFLSFAQTWRTKVRPDALRNQVLNDGHAPPKYRVSTVRNVDAWYAAFSPKPGQALYLEPKDRVRVW